MAVSSVSNGEITFEGEVYAIELFQAVNKAVKDSGLQITVPELGQSNNVLADGVGEVRIFRANEKKCNVTIEHDFRN